MSVKTKSHIIEYKEFESFEALPEEWQKLVDKSIVAIKSAHAPYSDFKVGAAIQLEDGSIIEGSNQENAAYPSGLCAERVALFYAHHKFPDIHIKKIAVLAENRQRKITGVSPCGACRQVMVEFSKENTIEILLRTKEGKYNLFNSVMDLVPFTFNKKNLDE
ncbi:cytidine deaminase [Marinigracilibium pacificum]|uniref:Cytidine deaminase n=1 Tax=Marinigracilibium pacificum TaxID=2729599 RepID=A0A848J802_9BACT|nr:cytidine deaminase [Marinigracilibium pacificum]NMM50554.1 cytidine deaminase [Marinigracilibium pacificum]